MNIKFQERLNSLKKEFEAGTQQMAALKARTGELRKTLLRISGAIQVLEELMAASEANPKKLSKQS